MNENNEHEYYDVIRVSENKRPIVLAATTLTLIIIIVVGLIVYFLTDESISKIILWILLCLVLLIGLVMIFYTEYQRRLAIKRKNQGAQNWVRTTIETQRRSNPASGTNADIRLPPVRTSWALNPRKWSVATPLPAYSPPHTTPT